MSDSPFESIPSGIDIARYFWHETDHKNPDYNGIDLYRDDQDYCYLWVEVVVDLDMYVSYLLDIRTKVGGTETRDYLSVFVGPRDYLEAEWHNKPIKFGVAGHWDRFHDGMKWFAGRIEAGSENEQKVWHHG